ncbi:hypothetical protein [Anaerobutyricum hallii]|uniref:hypothetical protein n=1 Tax=Anaerobutyricum hallii TaxID=39488 RepID=UPI0039917D29
MAVIVKKNELERYLRSHKCNKTNILHIVRTLKIKHVCEDYTFNKKSFYMLEEIPAFSLCIKDAGCGLKQYSPTLFFYLILSSIILFMYESAIDERRIIFVLYEFITINVRRNKKNVGEK